MKLTPQKALERQDSRRGEENRPPAISKALGRAATLRFVPGSSPPQSLSPVELTQALLEVQKGERGQRAALVTVIERRGSAPQVTGARLLLLEDHRVLGTVGGGAIEGQAIEAAKRCLKTGKAQRVSANLVRDLAMCCGGSMELFVEYITAQQRLILIGGGHVAQALVQAATPLGMRTVVIDDRQDMLAHPHFESSDRRLYDADELDEGLSDLAQSDLVAIATRDHARDEKAMDALLKRGAIAYLGMIGSQRKVISVMQRILRRYDERQLPRPALQHVHAPIGLALGGKTPAEIAISVLSEIIALRYDGNGGPMDLVRAMTQDLGQDQDLSPDQDNAPPGKTPGAQS